MKENPELTQPKEILPLLPKLRTFPIVRKLRRQDSFDILLISSEHHPPTNRDPFHGIRELLIIAILLEHVPPEFMVAVFAEVPQSFVE